MKNKKLTAVLLSLAVALLAGCGEKDTHSLSDSSVESSVISSVPETGNDNISSGITSEGSSVSSYESSTETRPESSITSDEVSYFPETSTSETQSEQLPAEDSSSPEEHHHEFKLINTVEATCTEPGYESYLCSCGEQDVKSASGALGHSYSKTVINATCTDSGYTTYTCTRCGHTYKSDHTDALGHNLVLSQTVKATCTKNGYTEHFCSRCNYKYRPAEEYTSALGHAWGDWTVTKAATTTAEGVKTSVCERCGEKKTASIAKLKADISTYASEVVRLVNNERAKQGLAPLTANSELMKYAQLRSTELVSLFAHQRPDGSDPLDYIMNMDNVWCAGENIAWGQKTPDEVMTSWMNSSGHRSNILDPDHTMIGVGCYESNGRLYWTQVFAGTRN